MGFPKLEIGEAIFLTHFEKGKAMGVGGIARQFTLTQSMGYVDIGDPYYPYRVPTEFSVDLQIDMLALHTVIMDVNEGVWTPEPPTPLPQPRLHD
jgi:hypothetical protein